MPRRPAAITQASAVRVLRAAQKVGAVSVEIRPDGTVVVHIQEPRQDRVKRTVIL